MSNIHPTHGQQVERFLKFLDSREALKNWLDAVDDPEQFVQIETPNMWIGEAFMWYSTPSGYAYWDLLDVQWQEELAKPITNQSN